MSRRSDEDILAVMRWICCLAFQLGVWYWISGSVEALCFCILRRDCDFEFANPFYRSQLGKAGQYEAYLYEDSNNNATLFLNSCLSGRSLTLGKANFLNSHHYEYLQRNKCPPFQYHETSLAIP